MKIKDLMKSVKTIDHEESVKKAAEIMGKYHFGSLIITKKSKAVGIITETDMVSKVVAKNKQASKLKVSEIMSDKLITLDENSIIDDAVYLMIKHKIKKLPVLRGEQVIGIVTSTDIVANSDEVGQAFLFD